ncbi:uncharacterized protein LOC141899504 isoform X2 [Tubulanus polymorphus]
MKPEPVTAGREAVYGWYPPQWNIYNKPIYKQLAGYDQECLFKHWYSAYTGQKVQAPVPPGAARPYNSASKPERCSTTASERSPPRSPTRSRPPKSPPKLNGSHAVDLSVQAVAKPLQEHPLSPRSSIRAHGPTTKEAWTGIPDTQESRPSTAYSIESVRATPAPRIPVPDLREYYNLYGSSSVSSEDDTSPPVSPSESTMLDVPVCSTPPKPTTKPVRVKSASLVRSSPSPPPRPIKSAGPSRSRAAAVATELSRPQAPTPGHQKSCPSPRTLRAKSAPATGRSLPTNREKKRPTTAALKIKPYLSTYDLQLSKYGWRMEVPADPLNLKRPIIADRLAYATKCTEPTLAGEPPRVHKEYFDTFFMNTIPRRKATFTISPDWASEVLHAKRIELQKREGINYRYKNFSFAY